MAYIQNSSAIGCHKTGAIFSIWLNNLLRLPQEQYSCLDLVKALNVCVGLVIALITNERSFFLAKVYGEASGNLTRPDRPVFVSLISWPL